MLHVLVKPVWVIVAILALSLLAPGTADAQGASEDSIPPTPIDLSVEVTSRFGLVVQNHSDVWVYNVKVRIDVDAPLVLALQTKDSDDYSDGVLTISAIEPKTVKIDSGRYAVAITNSRSTSFSGVLRISASIISSSPEETAGFQYNNHVERWGSARTTSSRLSNVLLTSMAVLGSVTERHPALNGQTTFTVAAKNRANPSRSSYRTKEGVEVKITLAPGMSFASSSMPDTTISGNTAIWRVGDLPATRAATRTKTLDVPVSLSGSAPLETRCLTAEVYRVRPPDLEHQRRDDVARVCLGDGPKEVLEAWPRVDDDDDQDRLDLFAWFPCIGVTAYPCNTDDTLELVGNFDLYLPYVTTKQRRDDAATSATSIGAGVMYLQPESLVIHVDDRLGRIKKDGDIIWSTDRVMLLAEAFNKLSTSWTTQSAVTVTAPDGGNAPGRWTLASTDGFAFLDAVDSTKVTGATTSVADYRYVNRNLVVGVRVDFSEMGTYKALYEIIGTLSGTTYTDSATYTFHVGPMADLEVRDGGASPAVATGRRAYTVEAVNNGPSAAAAIEVKLTGVPEGAVADPGQGSYAQGACRSGLCEGVWTVGELAAPETARLSGRSTSATLAIIADGDPITATIESARDYTVCIDGNGGDVAASSRSACEAGGNSWHSAEYYDHTTSDCFDSAGQKVDASSRSDCEATGGNSWYSNDRDVRIASQPGTGTGYPDAPAGVRVVETSVANILMWQPVERVNGFEVTHYEVQRQASPWTTLADDVGGTVYADMDVRPGQLTPYRVRAVNRLGGPGPWSSPTLTAPDAPGDFTAEQLQGGEVRLTWTKPDGNGAAIIGYTIQVSTNGGQSWSDTGANLGADDTSWTHSNLSVGPVRLYRIRASTAHGPGPWAQAASADVAAPELAAYYLDGPSRIELSWTMPESNAVPVLSYELQQSPDGSAWSRLATVQSSDGMSYTHSGLSPGAIRHYRIRAVTALGHSPWSETAQAATAAGVPRNLRAQSNGPNEIVLTWTKPSGDAQIWGYHLDRKAEGIDWRRSTPKTGRPTWTITCRPEAPGATGCGPSAAPASNCWTATGRRRPAPPPTPAGPRCPRT